MGRSGDDDRQFAEIRHRAGLAAGSYGVFVPHELTWSYEHVEEPIEAPRFRKIEHLGELAAVIEGLS